MLHYNIPSQVISDLIPWPVLSCLVLSCLVLSCLVLFCLVLFCLVLSYLVLSLQALKQGAERLVAVAQAIMRDVLVCLLGRTGPLGGVRFDIEVTTRTVQHSTVQYSTVQYSTVQYSIV